MRLVGRSKIKARLNEVDRKVQQLATEAGDYFRSVTPIRTGNARSKTKTVGREIRADYDYAMRLNEGYSRQAPNGMTTPTVKEIQNIVRKL